MKAALGTIPDKYVYSAYLGERSLASIYQGTTKSGRTTPSVSPV